MHIKNSEYKNWKNKTDSYFLRPKSGQPKHFESNPFLEYDK